MKTLKHLQKFGWLPVLLLAAQLSHGQTGTFDAVIVDKNGLNQVGPLSSATATGYGLTIGMGGTGIASPGINSSNPGVINGLNFYTNQVSRMFISPSGNVGIGTSDGYTPSTWGITTAPTAKLTVNGKGPVSWPATTGSTQNPGQIARFQGDAVSVLDIGSNGSFGAWLQSTAASNLSTNFQLLLNPNGGNVGIGTTAPISQLANTSTNIIGTDGAGTNAQSINWLMNNGGYTAAFANTGTTGNSNGLAVKVANAGSVALDVSQNASMSANGTSLLRVNGNGTVGIGTSTPAAKLDVNGNANVTGTIQINTSDADKIYLTAAGSAGSKIGHAFGWGVLNYAGPGTANLQGFHSWLISTSAGYAEQMRVTPTGLGIGTTMPTQKLDVNGGILARASGSISNQGAYLQWNRTNGEGETWLLNQKGAGTSNAGIRFGSATTGNVVTEWARFLDNGNFGIGTTTPTHTLEVNGTAAFGTLSAVTTNAAMSAAGLLIADPDNANNGALGTAASLTASGGLAFGATTSTGYGEGIASKRTSGGNQYGLDFYTGATNRLSITNQGYVGIGTTAPISQLANTATNIIGTDNRGTNSQSINWLMAKEGYTAAFANTGTASNNNGLAVKVANTSSVALDVSQGASMSTAGTSLLRVNSNGTVGIGTPAPAALLDVNGSTRLNGSVLVGSNITKFNTIAAAKTALYGLWVEKGVVANDFAIAAPTTWADFVFAPGYRLTPLSETERYIRQHGHLPEMPSADDVKKDGYSVHEMNTRLLQKIEELTLHSIAQEKQIEALTAMQAQLRQVEALAAEVARLKAAMAK